MPYGQNIEWSTENSYSWTSLGDDVISRSEWKAPELGKYRIVVVASGTRSGGYFRITLP